VPPLRRGELERHGALNHMADALLDASLVLLACVVTVTDLRSRLVPDAALAIALVVALGVCLLSDPAGVPVRLTAGTGAAGSLLAAALVRPEGMGLGDVKLAGVLGVYLAGSVIEAMLVAFAAGSVAGLALIARHGWEARRRTIPFAPFLALGAVVTLVARP
jgi:leader peptidase (prepilin peptidase) / N-methyltransferase